MPSTLLCHEENRIHRFRRRVQGPNCRLHPPVAPVLGDGWENPCRSGSGRHQPLPEGKVDGTYFLALVLGIVYGLVLVLSPVDNGVFR